MNQDLTPAMLAPFVEISEQGLGVGLNIFLKRKVALLGPVKDQNNKCPVDITAQIYGRPLAAKAPSLPTTDFQAPLLAPRPLHDSASRSQSL